MCEGAWDNCFVDSSGVGWEWRGGRVVLSDSQRRRRRRRRRVDWRSPVLERDVGRIRGEWRMVELRYVGLFFFSFLSFLYGI